MASGSNEFEPTPFTGGRISADKILRDDEHRLFNAHRQLASKGHPSQFPLRLQARLSAPFAVEQNGASKVLTMDIDTVGMLSVLPRDRIARVITVKTANDGPDNPDATVIFSRMSNGSAWRSSLEYGDDMPEDHECLRADILAWAQAQFAAGVADMAKGQMFDRIAFARLQSGIRQGVDGIFDRLVYIPGHDRGDFIEESAPPRLVCRHYSNSDTDVVMKLQRRGENPAATWTGILASMPAELAVTASRLRFAVMNAVAGHERSPLDAGFLEGWEDTVHKGFSAVRRDQADFEDLKAAETALFARGVRSMAKDMIRYHDDGHADFSEATLGACLRFLEVEGGPDVNHAEWGEAVSALREALREDEAPMTAFLERAGWELAPSPVLFMKAKMNLFADHDLSVGLYGDAKPAKNRSDRGPKR